MTPTKEHISYLRVVILGQMLLEANDDLKFTTAYSQSTKNLINRLSKNLEHRVSSDFDSVYNTDPEMTTNILRYILELSNKICTFDIDELVMVNAVIDKYKENIEWFKEHGSAEFLKLNNI